MKTLEKKLIGLKTELSGLKTSQRLGGSSYRVCHEQTSIKTTLNGYKYYWVYFRGNSNFPLVNFGFEVWENGVLKKEPLDDWHNNIGGDSLGKYSLNTIWGPLLASRNISMPAEFDPYAPNVYAAVLTMESTESVNLAIILKAKTSCEGVLGYEGR